MKHAVAPTGVPSVDDLLAYLIEQAPHLMRQLDLMGCPRPLCVDGHEYRRRRRSRRGGRR